MYIICDIDELYLCSINTGKNILKIIELHITSVGMDIIISLDDNISHRFIYTTIHRTSFWKTI